MKKDWKIMEMVVAAKKAGVAAAYSASMEERRVERYRCLDILNRLSSSVISSSNPPAACVQLGLKNLTEHPVRDIRTAASSLLKYLCKKMEKDTVARVMQMVVAAKKAGLAAAYSSSAADRRVRTTRCLDILNRLSSVISSSNPPASVQGLKNLTKHPVRDIRTTASSLLDSCKKNNGGAPLQKPTRSTTPADHHREGGARAVHVPKPRRRRVFLTIKLRAKVFGRTEIFLSDYDAFPAAC